MAKLDHGFWPIVMDCSLILEVLIEKGYLTILEGCAVLLIVLLILKKVLPRHTYIRVNFTVSKDKVYLEEEFEARVSVRALRNVNIRELSFYIECLTLSPESLGFKKRKSFFFKKDLTVQDVKLYRQCICEEKFVIKIPEKDKLEDYLPGSFSSVDNTYRIIWEAGCSVKLQEIYEKIEKKQCIVVYPVRAGW